MNEINGSTPLTFLTVDQFFALNEQNRQLTETKIKEVAPTEKHFAYGLKGLMSIANCCKKTAQDLKNSGRISYFQSGRMLIFDVDLVLSELAKPKTV